MASWGKNYTRGTNEDRANRLKDHEALIEMGTSMPKAAAKSI
jgi:hypothetical protein